MYHVDDWTKTALGTPIPLYASHAPDRWARLNPILAMGGVHGDEPLGVTLAEKTLEFLRVEDEKPRAPWILIPCLNVDGFKALTRVNGRGVDLNRNYPARNWSPVAAKPRYHPGPHAASEPEVRAVVELILSARPRLILHFHSWQPSVVCAGEPGLRDAERLARASGYRVQPEIGYPTPGSLSDFGWFDNQIPVICTEEDDHTPAARTWDIFGPGLREIFLDASPR